VTEAGTCCNDVLRNRRDPLTLVGTTMMTALAPTAMMQQKLRCPFDDLGRDDPDLAKNGNLATLASGEVSGYVSSSWSLSNGLAEASCGHQEEAKTLNDSNLSAPSMLMAAQPL